MCGPSASDIADTSRSLHIKSIAQTPLIHLLFYVVMSSNPLVRFSPSLNLESKYSICMLDHNLVINMTLACISSLEMAYKLRREEKKTVNHRPNKT